MTTLNTLIRYFYNAFVKLSLFIGDVKFWLTENRRLAVAFIFFFQVKGKCTSACNTLKLSNSENHEHIHVKYPCFCPLLWLFWLCFRQAEDEPLRVSTIDDLERIRISRHKLERSVMSHKPRWICLLIRKVSFLNRWFTSEDSELFLHLLLIIFNENIWFIFCKFFFFY